MFYFDTHYAGAYGVDKGTRGDRPQRGRGEVMECMGAGDWQKGSKGV